MSVRNIFLKTEILSVLSLIETKYVEIYPIATVKNAKLMKSYAQIAIIAIGGWLEDGLKELTKLSIINLNDLDRQDKITKMVESIYGFSYTGHFSKAIILTYGIHGYEYIETKVGDSDIAILSSSLGLLKSWRDDVAHSHRTAIPCNPTQVIIEFKKIFPILKKIEKYAREYKKDHF